MTQFFADQFGAQGLGPTLRSDTTSGKVSGNVKDPRYDPVVNNVPDAPRSFLDQVGSFKRGNSRVLEVAREVRKETLAHRNRVLSQEHEQLALRTRR